MLFFVHWAAMLFDLADQRRADTAASDAVRARMGQALLQHPLFFDRATTLRLLVAQRPADDAVLSIIHEVDAIYIVPGAFSVGMCFSDREWEWEESAHAFFCALRTLAAYEGKTQEELYHRFGRCAVRRQGDAEASDRSVPDGVVDRFVNRGVVANIEEFVLQLAHDSAGRQPLRRRQVRQRVLLANQMGNAELLAEAMSRGLQITPAADTPAAAAAEGEAFVGQATGRPLPQRKVLDLQRLVGTGLITQEFADNVWNPDRPTGSGAGMWGIHCYCNMRGRFTAESTFEDWKAANGKSPFIAGGGTYLQPHEVLLHWKEECFHLKRAAEQLVQQKKADASILTDLPKAEQLARREASRLQHSRG